MPLLIMAHNHDFVGSVFLPGIADFPLTGDEGGDGGLLPS